MRLLILFLLATAPGWGQLEDLGREYRELRKQTGHFSGGDTWNDAVDHWKGRKHEVMAELGRQLGQVRTDRLLQIMGPPDERRANRWIYFWRGGHDYLYFEVEGARVTSSHWWMAGE